MDSSQKFAKERALFEEKRTTEWHLTQEEGTWVVLVDGDIHSIHAPYNLYEAYKHAFGTHRPFLIKEMRKDGTGIEYAYNPEHDND